MFETIDDAVNALQELAKFVTRVGDVGAAAKRALEANEAELTRLRGECKKWESRLADYQDVCSERDRLMAEVERLDPGRRRAKLAEEQQRLAALQAAMERQQALIKSLEQGLQTQEKEPKRE